MIKIEFKIEIIYVKLIILKFVYCSDVVADVYHLHVKRIELVVSLI
jgi:hypothetical protein